MLPTYRAYVCVCVCTQGFQRIREALDEEALDYGPHARKVYDTLCKQGAKDGWLVSDAPDTAAA